MSTIKVVYDVKAQVVPREDLLPGMTVHPSQLLNPAPEDVFEKAKLGLSMKALAAIYKIATPTLTTHFSKTIAAAKAEKAAELLIKISYKADDELTKGDMSAIKFLLNRLDPEDKEPSVVIQQQFNISDKVKTLPIEELNDILTKED